MADLVTHLATALLPGALVGRRIAPVVLGTALPDLAARVVPMALEALQSRGAPIPDAVIWMFGVLHEPFPLGLLCVVVACAFTATERWRVLWGLWLGGALHLGLDLLQDHHGQGYFLFAPFFLHRYELGWIGSEATVSWAPWLAAATAGAWLARRARMRYFLGERGEHGR